MANMSYCRFQNTVRDLADCERALADGAGAPDDDMSAEERRAMKSLVRLCQRIADDYSDVLDT